MEWRSLFESFFIFPWVRVRRESRSDFVMLVGYFGVLVTIVLYAMVEAGFRQNGQARFQLYDVLGNVLV